jgi:hypothetical protein
MRSAGNFSPEWGYLAPAPSFMRTARIVAVATAIGATAGAGVVLSLLDRPAAEGDRTSLVAVHAIVTSVQAATAPAATAPIASAPVTAVVPTNAATIVPAVQTKAAVQPGPAAATRPAAVAPPKIPAVRAPAANIPAANISAASVGASGANAVAAPQASPDMTALSDPSSATDAPPAGLPDGTTVTPDMAPPPKKTTHHSTNNQPTPGLGTALRRMFSAHAGTSYYPNN